MKTGKEIRKSGKIAEKLERRNKENNKKESGN